MRKRQIIAAVLIGSLWAGLAQAAATPQSVSLNTCQKMLAVQARLLLTRQLAVFQACLQKMADGVIRNQDLAHAARAAAPLCIAQLRKVCDSRLLGRSVGEKFLSAVGKRCTPGQRGVSHTLADILGRSLTTVGQPLNAKDLDLFRAMRLTSLDDWYGIFNPLSPHRLMVTELVAEFPRAIEWAKLLQSEIDLVEPPATDSNRSGDASNCIGALVEQAASASGAYWNGSALDTSQINTPINVCAMRLASSGDPGPHTANRNDGNPSAVPVQPEFPYNWTSLNDAYHDNGDGTITDIHTGLMWERKDDSGGLHDRDDKYQYDGDGTQETIWDWLDDVNAEGGTGFAGYNDWRIPNVKELQSIVSYGQSGPAVEWPFNWNFSPGCSVTDCSCTRLNYYWASTTYDTDPTNAWAVLFVSGGVSPVAKTLLYHVRAVRGGF